MPTNLNADPIHSFPNECNLEYHASLLPWLQGMCNIGKALDLFQKNYSFS